MSGKKKAQTSQVWGILLISQLHKFVCTTERRMEIRMKGPWWKNAFMDQVVKGVKKQPACEVQKTRGSL